MQLSRLERRLALRRLRSSLLSRGHQFIDLLNFRFITRVELQLRFDRFLVRSFLSVHLDAACEARLHGARPRLYALSLAWLLLKDEF